MNITDSSSIMATDGLSGFFDALNLGWYDGYGYLIDSFYFNATEGDTVLIRIYDSLNKKDATNWLDSAEIILPDIKDPPFPQGFQHTFDFSNSSLETTTIPEPTTLGFMGLIGLGMLLTRKKLRS